jgi:hypothetical protein
METSYDVINPLTPTKNSKHPGYSMSSPPSLSNVSSASSRSSYNDSNNNSLGVSKQLNNQQHQVHTSNNKKHQNHNHNQHNRKELDISKIANKLDYPKSNYYYGSQEKRNLHKQDYEMNVIKMQGYGHNVDYVNYIYINKVFCVYYSLLTLRLLYLKSLRKNKEK